MLTTILITVGLVALDQLTKYLATLYLAPVGTLPFLPGLMELQYILNDGAAFSSLSGKRGFLIAVTGIALAVLAWYLLFRKPQNRVEYAGWLLVFAGGIGNLIDRVLHGPVVDFFAVTFVDFAVFNVADCFVTVGVFLLILHLLVEEYQNSRKKKSEASFANADKPMEAEQNGES